MNTIVLSASMSAAFVLGLTFGTLACTTAEPPSKTPATLTQAQTPTACPLGVKGAHVAVEDTEAGVAMTFTAPLDRLGELRERTFYAAAMHGPGAGVGKGHDGKHGTGGEHGLKAMQLPPSYAVAEEMAGGARIWIRPADPADLPVLREKIRDRGEAMMAPCR
jgi:hypothetical protein